MWDFINTHRKKGSLETSSLRITKIYKYNKRIYYKYLQIASFLVLLSLHLEEVDKTFLVTRLLITRRAHLSSTLSAKVFLNF